MKKFIYISLMVVILCSCDIFEYKETSSRSQELLTSSMAKMSTLISSIALVKELGDWLNANHFDYRGLIEKGLALEAPEGMYKIE